MIPNKGRYLDCNPINQPPGTWRAGKNFVVNKKKGAFVTEPGTDLTATDFPFAIAKPIGSTVFPDGSYIQFADGINGGEDRIGIVNKDGIYSDLIVDDILGFDSSFPIRSYEIDYNAFGERIVGFTDFKNSFRVINVDLLPFTLNPDKSLVNPADISDLEAFPKFKLPIVSFVVNQVGGSIPSGAYSACFAYESNDGTRTPTSPPSKMIYITDDSTTVGFDKFDGIPPRTRTPKSITFTITNVDTRYDKLVLVILRKVGGITEAAQIKKVDITGITATITYVGSETESAMTTEEVLTPRPLYTKVGCVAQLNSQLYLGDLESETDIDYQSYANNIKAFYNTKLVSANNVNDSHKNVLPGGFPHGGVVALYIAFVLKNGSWSRGFHIPGRTVQGSEAGNSGLAVAAGLPSTTKVYQIEDTTNNPQPAYSLDGDTTVADMTGPTNMGFWENQNEVYPTNFPGGLGGQKVRHHVFPTIRKCKLVHYSGIAGYGRDQFDVLGLDVTNVVIPVDIQDKIEGWAIFYADRNYSNSNTLGTDIHLVAHKTDLDASVIWSAGGNWKTNSFDGTGDWATDFDTNPDYLRGHNFELLKDMPSLSPSSLFIDFELKIRKQNLIADYKLVGKAGGSVAMSGEGQGQNAGMVVDLTDTSFTTVTLPGAQLIRGVEEFKYLPANIVDGNIRTLKNEDIIHLKIFQGSTIPFTKSEVHINSSGRTPNTFPTTAGFGAAFVNGGEDTYLISYKQIKTDLYDEFNNQLLTLTDTLCLPSETSRRKIRGGDTFLNVRSFLSISPRHAEDFEKVNGTTVIRAHISENRYNIGLRHEVVGDVATKYYPKTAAVDFWDNPGDPDTEGTQMIFDRTANPNGLGYNTDYNATNTYNQLTIYTVNQRLTNKFPYRVIRGGANNGARSDINGWKTFLAADYYESNRNRGKITDLFVMDDILFIQHMYGLFRTLGTEKLSLSTTEVYLGSGDVFAQRPKELISSELGFLGSQNIFAGVTFEGGRFWPDQSRGKVFLINKQGVSEISKDGMYEFFRDNLMINNTYPDSPIVGEGLIAAYDPKYERIILCKKSNSNPFTISYSLEKEQNYWAFDHDYIPDYLFSTSNSMYGYKDNRIHKYGSATKVAKYFEGDIKRSEVEIIFNPENQRNKEYFNFNWISEVFNQAGALQKGITLSAIRVRTSYQDSGEVPLVAFTTYGVAHNMRRFKNTWNFNKGKDANADPFKRKTMVDNYCSVTFIFNNAANLDTTQNSLYLYLLNTKAILAEL